MFLADAYSIMQRWFNKRTSLILLNVLFFCAVLILNGCGSSGGGKKNVPNVPSSPASLTATAGDGFITLTWDSVADAVSYNIYMASVSGVTKGNYAGLADGMKHSGVTSPFKHINLTNGKTYYFIVTAVSSSGESEDSDEVSGTPVILVDTTPPAGITNLHVNAITTSSITLSWTVPGDDGSSGTASAYDIRYSNSEINDSNWVTAVTLTGEPSPQTAGTDQTFTVTGLTCGTTYYFGVKTSDEVPNTSSLSNIATSPTSNCPDVNAPSNTTGNDFINSGAVYTTSVDVTLAISAADVEGVAGYYVSENPAVPSASGDGWTAIVPTTSYSGSVPFILSSANGSKDLYVWFKDAGGNVSASRSDSIILDNIGPSVSLTAISGPVRGTINISTTVSDITSGISKVEFYRGVTKIGEAAASPYSTLLDTTATPDGSYSIKAKAYDTAGNFAETDPVNVNVDNTPSSNPSGINVQVINKNRIDIRWTAPPDTSGIASYNIFRNGVFIGTSTTTSFSDTSVISGNNYIYTVSANDSAGNESAKSSPISGIPRLAVVISLPANLITVGTNTVTVSGVVNDSSAIVTVNGIVAAVSNGQFEVPGITVTEGMNTIVARAIDADNDVATASVNISLDSTPPHVAITSPPDGYTTASSPIIVTGIINDIVRGTVNESQGNVQVNGIEAVISNRNFTVESVPLVPGPNTITASGSDQWGNTARTEITVILDTTPRQTLTIESGNNQSSLIGTMLSNPLVVSLKDENNTPVSGEPVIFRVAENNGVILDPVSGSGVRAAAVITDVNGQAQAEFRVGTWAGSGNNRVDVTATGVDGNVIFIASGTQKPPAAMYVAQGNQQRGGVNQPLPEPLVAFVTDEGHNPLDNVPLIFRAVEGGGLFLNGLDNLTVNSDSDGRAAVSFILGPNAGNDSNVIEATFEGNPMPPAGFTATGLIPGDPGDTKISGVVLDNSNNPITNVTVRVEGTTREAVTDNNGQFTVNNVPVGPLHLIADGTTAGTPGILEYPTLMYELTTVAGANNSVGMPIYLVPLDLVNSKVVGGSADVTYTIPEVPGFSLTVKANSVTFPNGDSQGSISVTQVHADKVPMVPQIGQQPRFIVTIQPPGTVFDPPAPITIPNVDGLAPGEKTNMYSFDHDLGIFVSIGTGTVSEDGTLIVSDPGVGVVKAGWHCGGNPAPTGSANNCPDCQKCDNNRCVTDAAKNNTCCGDGTKICQGGSCNPVTLTSATAKANGQDEVTIAKNDTVNFTGTVSGSNCEYEYNWDFGDGGTSTAQSPSHRYTTIGEYTVTFRVRCKRCGPPEKVDTVKVLVGIAIDITSTVPPDELILGESAVINYEIKPPGQSFDTVVMEIRNTIGDIVVKKEGLPVSAGAHSTSWENARWNQGAFNGKFANPKNGPYQIKMIGTKDGDTDDDTSPLNTKLVIEADIKDEKTAGSGAARSAGLGDLIDALKIVMKLGGSETVVSGAGSITVTGAAHDQKHIKVDAPALNNLDSGVYDVLFRDLRDEVGNFADEDGSTGNGIQPLKFPLEIR